MIKRALDILVSTLALLLLWPLASVVALAIWCEDGRPVLFRQIRVGRNGRPFRILKFRTMRVASACRGPLVTVPGDARITRVGRFLRDWKLDELPQFLNILRGEMSLVGPRPEVRRFVRAHAAEYREILRVRPGLTDLASIAYRDEAELLADCDDPEAEYVRQLLPDKLRLTREYVRRASLGFDLWIVLCTALAVLRPARGRRQPFERLSRYHRGIATVLQAAVCALAHLAARALLAAEPWSFGLTPGALGTVLIVVPVRVLWLRVFHLDRDLWRFVGLHELAQLSAATALSTLLLVLLPWVGLPALPPPLLLLDGVLAIGLLAGIRIARRMYHELGGRLFASRRVLIVGSHEQAERVLHDLSRCGRQPFRCVGMVTEENALRGLRVHDVPILGSYDEIESALESTGAEEVLVAAAGSPSEVRRELARRCRATERPVRVAHDLISALASPLPARRSAVESAAVEAEPETPRVEELLPHGSIPADREKLRDSYAGRAVLVTGAGGSIGSELCRQLAGCEPSHLVMFEKHERSLYEIDRELRSRYPQVRLTAVIGDIRDVDRVQQVFRDTRPDCVFHAAAYKHVPMMEHNSSEAFKTNVLGTRTLAGVADREGVATFVMISTDKAVEPVSVMGATKRMAELIVQGLSRVSRTRFETVRFGNVLESSGSVVPLFREQIERGGPVTVTHPEVTRWFMTVPEAVQLILEVRAMCEGGEIFVLDMGRPVRVCELARALIRQYGLRPDVDIPIVFTGLRSGERLFEKLFNDHEIVWKTDHPRILRAVDLSARGGDALARPEEFRRLWKLVSRALPDGSAQELQRHAAELGGMIGEGHHA